MVQDSKVDSAPDVMQSTIPQGGACPDKGSNDNNMLFLLCTQSVKAAAILSLRNT